MKLRRLSILFALALLVVTPVYAAEIVDPEDVPVPDPVATERSSEAFAVDGRTLGVSRWEYVWNVWESGDDDLFHWVWHDLDPSGAIVATFEYIIVEGNIYERRDTEQRWKAAPIDSELAPISRDLAVFHSKVPPAAFPDDFIITYVGDVQVEGALAGQYQHTLPEDLLPDDVTMFKLDFFIRREPLNGIRNYASIYHFTLGLRNETGGETVLKYHVAWSDPNTAITINPPPADLVDWVAPQALGEAFQPSPAMALWLRGRAVQAQLRGAGQ